MLSRSLYKALTVEVMACRGVDMVEYLGSRRDELGDEYLCHIQTATWRWC